MYIKLGIQFRFLYLVGFKKNLANLLSSELKLAIFYDLLKKVGHIRSHSNQMTGIHLNIDRSLTNFMNTVPLLH